MIRPGPAHRSRYVRKAGSRPRRITPATRRLGISGALVGRTPQPNDRTTSECTLKPPPTGRRLDQPNGESRARVGNPRSVKSYKPSTHSTLMRFLCPTLVCEWNIGGVQQPPSGASATPSAGNGDPRAPTRDQGHRRRAAPCGPRPAPCGPARRPSGSRLRRDLGSTVGDERVHPPHRVNPDSKIDAPGWSGTTPTPAGS
jgi:hypothetical protein